MTDLTKQRPSYNPWTGGFALLWPSRTPGGSPRRKRGSWLTALRCRLRRRSIDTALAAGADPDSTGCRHRRASELTGPSNRQELAAAYEDLLVATTSVPRHDPVPVNWSGVRAVTPRLAHLVQRLREDPRVRPQGVARARLLLDDRTSALYAKDDDLSLVDEVRSTLALL